METPRGLTARMDRLEQLAGQGASLPCVGCGLPHFYEVLSLDSLAERHQGSQAPLPAMCGCPCCAPLVGDLLARYSSHLQREAGAA